MYTYLAKSEKFSSTVNAGGGTDIETRLEVSDAGASGCKKPPVAIVEVVEGGIAVILDTRVRRS